MKERYLMYFLLITVFLTFLVVVYPFAIYMYFGDVTLSGSFGDSYGALNALFSGMAFAGIIITIVIQKKELENQRIELKLQRDEMIETRKEFSLNRTTNVIYSQLERFENSLDQLIIVHGEKEYRGNDAIFYLEKNKEIVMNDDELSEAENLLRRKDLNYRQSAVLIENRGEIEKFAIKISNSVNVLKSLLFNSKLEIYELNELKNLYFQNIGYMNMSVIEGISELAQEQIELFETDDYIRYNIDVGQLLRADIFLKPVIEFYKSHFTEENYPEARLNWLKQSK